MFGYVRYSKPDLTFRDFYKYRAYYCGVCHSIKNNFGQLGRLALNYDIVFMALLLSGTYGGDDKFQLEKCMLNPFKKKKIILNEYIDYCSSINVLFFYFKMLDDYKDNRSVPSLLFSKMLYKSYLKVKDKYPNKERIMREGMERIHFLEKSDKTALDDISQAFGEILGEMFVYNSECQQFGLLREVGYNLGKLVYIFDSIDDLEEDAKRKRFNPLINFSEYRIEKKVDDLLEEIEYLIMRLDIKHSKEIICNIVKQGLRNKSNVILGRSTEGS
jgi:hypothetical protein